MKRKKRKMRGLSAVVTLLILLGGLFCVNAVEVRAQPGDFFIEAELMPSDKETYSVRLTVENRGADWEGTVRLTADESYRRPSAYDTSLSLPQGSRKQFVVKIPVNSIRNTNGTVYVTLWDRKDSKTAEKEFTRLLKGDMGALNMGILSDAYSKLTYLDMGGQEIYFYGEEYPIKLVGEQQGSLIDELDTLTFLVIDQYNTGILTEEELEAIELWVYNGGVLLIGTGAYAEDTLRGFDGGYLDIASWVVSTPGDEFYQKFDFMVNEYEYVDFSQLTLTELQDTDSSYTDYYVGRFESMGDGSICVLPYSLAELGGLDESYWNVLPEDYVMGLLDIASSNARSRHVSSTSSYDDYGYQVQRLLKIMGNSNSILNFGGLKAIVILYVIFVGPVLYLILRLMKKRELYWIAVPVTALLGICLVYFAGRGFEVVSTKVYSVTMKDLSTGGNAVSYLYCYDANRKEWELRMADGCAYAGPFGSASYSGSADEYYYHIQREGDSVFLGVKPEANFDDCYFYLSSSAYGNGVEGSLLLQDVQIDTVYPQGTVVNGTNRDMSYFAVIWNDSLFVYEGLSAGDSCRLEDLTPLNILSGNNYYSDSYVYNFLSNYYNKGKYDEVSTLAALGVGIKISMAQAARDEVTVIGVVENWDKTVNDDCSEISYGCLYAVQ